MSTLKRVQSQRRVGRKVGRSEECWQMAGEGRDDGEASKIFSHGTNG